jgi:hypothetical protein
MSYRRFSVDIEGMIHESKTDKDISTAIQNILTKSCLVNIIVKSHEYKYEEKVGE